MSRVPGTPKTGGRKKGQPNIRTRELIEILDNAGYCPVARLIAVAEAAEKEYQRAEQIYDAIEAKKDVAGITTPTADMAPHYLKLMETCAADLLPYMYPKRKSIEVTGQDGQNVFQSLTDVFKEMYLEEQRKLNGPPPSFDIPGDNKT